MQIFAFVAYIAKGITQSSLMHALGHEPVTIEPMPQFFLAFSQ
jgi:hypothetical protein